MNMVRIAVGQLARRAVLDRLDKDVEVTYNTIITPKGGQYQVVLPDGTTVCLNAASSLKYPTAFVGSERHVELNGEAYFEVTKNKNMPFTVSAGAVNVRVLGTHFDISAYDDDPSNKTTLLEGGICIVNSNRKLTLKPGEQAIIKQGDNMIELKKDADIKQVVAWKNGLFRFHQTGLHELMRELLRWYNINILYKGDVKDELFYGTISRKLTLSQTLEILQTSNIHFKIGTKTANSAGTLTVTP